MQCNASIIDGIWYIAFRKPSYRCEVKGPLEGGCPGVFVRCQNLPKIYEIYGFLRFAGNAPEMSRITGTLPETSDWGPQPDVSGKFPVALDIFGAFPAKIKNP